jgi:methyl-accepting chemotaxis protein
MKIALAALLAGLAGAGLMYWKGQRDTAALKAEVARLSKLAASNSTAAEVKPPTGTEEHDPAKTVEKIVTVKVPDEATRQELVRLLDEKNAKLNAAESSARELRERINDLEAKLAQAVRDTEQLTASQKDLKEQVSVATRLADSLREQSQQREERLAQAEVSSQDLRKRSEETARRLTRLSELTDQMDDVSRRRDVFLNNVLRRFREATELFRTLALRIDDPNLARIQQTVMAADEDLRQVQALNAQAAKLQKDQALARK